MKRTYEVEWPDSLGEPPGTISVSWLLDAYYHHHPYPHASVSVREMTATIEQGAADEKMKPAFDVSGCRIETLTLGPNDRLVIICQHRLSNEARLRLQETGIRCFPDMKYPPVVYDDGLRLCVLRESDKEQSAGVVAFAQAEEAKFLATSSSDAISKDRREG